MLLNSLKALQNCQRSKFKVREKITCPSFSTKFTFINLAANCFNWAERVGDLDIKFRITNDFDTPDRAINENLARGENLVKMQQNIVVY